MNILGAGRAVLWRPRDEPRFHLWFILTDPAGNPPTVVAVCLRSMRRFADETVVLHPGDHPFIRHESFVLYSTARRFRVDRLLRALEHGRCHLKEDMGPELLERVRAGLLASPFTVNAIRDACEALFG